MSKKFLLKFLAFFFVANVAFAQEISTNDLMKEIEKTMLFDKESRERIDIYKKKAASRKSDFTINAGIPDEDEDTKVDIVVADPKSENFDLRAKEKLAYNSTLVGQYEVAIELYKQVISAEPDNNYAKFSLAVVYQKMGQFTQAKVLYRDLLKTDPANQDEVVGNLLAIMVEETPRDAVYLLSRLSVQNPSSAYVLAQAAIAYDKAKNYEQAISLLKKAVNIDEDNLAYKYNLAVIYDKNEQYEKALEMYSLVAKNYSDSSSSIVPIEQIEKRITSIRNKV